MHVLLTGGGTGGHIYPAITVAAEIRRLAPDAKFTYVGTASGLEADVVPKAGIPFQTIAAGGWVGKGLVSKLQAALTLAVGAVQALVILRRCRPAVILATGGFVSGPVLLAAVLARVPFALWEGNAFPGATVRLFSPWAGAVFVPFPEVRRHLLARARAVACGNPVRQEILQADRRQARAALSLRPEQQLLLVVGGSQGAWTIHRAVVGAAAALGARPGLRLLHITGARQYDAVRTLYLEAGVDPAQTPWLQLQPYLHDISTALAAADLAVTRAGAGTVAELAARGLPAIIIPLSRSTHGHQQYNAEALADRGGALIISEADLTPQSLAAAAADLLGDDNRRQKMVEALKAAAHPEAAGAIAAKVLALGRGEKG